MCVCVYCLLLYTQLYTRRGVRGRAADAQAYTSVPFFCYSYSSASIMCILSRSQKLAVHEGIYTGKRSSAFPRLSVLVKPGPNAPTWAVKPLYQTG